MKGISNAESLVRSSRLKYLKSVGLGVMFPIHTQTTTSDISCHLTGFCELINNVTECLYNKTVIELET